MVLDLVDPVTGPIVRVQDRRVPVGQPGVFGPFGGAGIDGQDPQLVGERGAGGGEPDGQGRVGGGGVEPDKRFDGVDDVVCGRHGAGPPRVIGDIAKCALSAPAASGYRPSNE